jgi:hypothetical protein
MMLAAWLSAVTVKFSYNEIRNRPLPLPFARVDTLAGGSPLAGKK